jgi:hypothetical protein
MADNPIQSKSLLLFEGVYLSMGEEYLRAELRKRKLSDEEVDQIVTEIQQRQDNESAEEKG